MRLDVSKNLAGGQGQGEARYAIYFAPPQGSPLGAFAARWLGRDAEGNAVERLPVPGFAPERLAEIVAPAGHYGFHATLKPPFALAPCGARGELDEALARFAAGQAPFAAPPLRLDAIAGFIALTLSAPCPGMDALAARCVHEFDAFRAPPAEAETAQRRSAGLTPRQDALLQRWGYPYVMEEFRFHMTLTGRLDAGERAALQASLAPLAAPLCAAPLQVDAVALFAQSDRAAPFRLARRYEFGGGA